MKQMGAILSWVTLDCRAAASAVPEFCSVDSCLCLGPIWGHRAEKMLGTEKSLSASTPVLPSRDLARWLSPPDLSLAAILN